jgi:hypothetical protein
MGYERNDRRTFAGDYGRGYGENRDRGSGGYTNERYGREAYRGGQGRYGPQRDPRGERFDDHEDYRGRQQPPRGYDDRGFFERAGDEVRSWFGDEEAERRRLQDERYSGYDRSRGFSGYGGSWVPEFGFGDFYGYGPDASYAAGNLGGSDQSRRPATRHDPGYRSWRDRQLDSFDRDYDEYRREHQSKFDSDFASWREQRQGQRGLLGKVQEHQEVVGSDGQHVGTVDHVRGDHIRLTRSDQDAGGHHHVIPSSWIQSVDERITLSKTADQAKQHWRDEQRNGGDNSGVYYRDPSFAGPF